MIEELFCQGHGRLDNYEGMSEEVLLLLEAETRLVYVTLLGRLVQSQGKW